MSADAGMSPPRILIHTPHCISAQQGLRGGRAALNAEKEGGHREGGGVVVRICDLLCATNAR